MYGYLIPSTEEGGADTFTPFKTGTVKYQFTNGNHSAKFTTQAESFILSVTGYANSNGTPSISISGLASKKALTSQAGNKDPSVTYGCTYGILYSCTATVGKSITVSVTNQYNNNSPRLFVGVFYSI